MRLFTPQDVPSHVSALVCRQSRIGTVIASLVFAILLVACPLALIAASKVSWWVGAPVLLFTGMLAKWLIGDALKSLRRTNWVLRIARDGLWINIRSFRNVNHPAAATVIYVPYDEVVGVNKHRALWLEKNDSETIHWKDQYLDVKLARAAPAEIRSEIAAERRRRVEKRYLRGIRVSSTNRHWPISLPGENVIRIGWRTRLDGVTPSLDKALREIKRFVHVLAPTEQDFTAASESGAGDVEGLILQLVESGNQFAAIKLLKKHQSYSHTEAKQFVDELIAAV